MVGNQTGTPINGAARANAFPSEYVQTGEEFTMYRGQSGVTHIAQHRCPHRRTQLSVGGGIPTSAGTY